MFDVGQELVFKARCISKRGLSRDLFFREFNETFTSKVEFKEADVPFVEEARKKKKGKLSDKEICQILVGSPMEVLELHVDTKDLPRPVKEQIADPPKPGQDGFDDKPLARRIQEHAQALDHKKDHHWEEDGSPSKMILSDWVGADVTREQIAASVPGMKRRVDTQ